MEAGQTLGDVVDANYPALAERVCLFSVLFTHYDCFLPAHGSAQRGRGKRQTTAGRESWPPGLDACQTRLAALPSSSSSLFPSYHRTITSSILLDRPARNLGFPLLQSAQDGPYETPLQSSCQHIVFWRKASWRGKPSSVVVLLFFFLLQSCK